MQKLSCIIAGRTGKEQVRAGAGQGAGQDRAWQGKSRPGQWALRARARSRGRRQEQEHAQTDSHNNAPAQGRGMPMLVLPPPLYLVQPRTKGLGPCECVFRQAEAGAGPWDAASSN